MSNVLINHSLHSPSHDAISIANSNNPQQFRTWLISVLSAAAIVMACALISKGLFNEHSNLDLTPYLQSLVVLISFILISVFSPSWSTTNRGFISVLVFAICSCLLIFTDNAFTSLGLVFLAYIFLVVSEKNKPVLLRLLIIYGVVIFALFIVSNLITGSQGAAFQGLSIAAYLLILGGFPLASWYGKLYENSSTGICAGFLVVQGLFASKSALFIPESSSLIHGIFLIVALLSSLEAAFQVNAKRGFAAMAASQLLFIAFIAMLPFDGLAKAKLYIIAVFTLATPGVILTFGALESRVGHLSLFSPQGNYSSYPRLANTLLFFSLLSAGFPLSLGYVGIDLLAEIVFSHESLIMFGWMVVISLNAIFSIRSFLYLCLGSPEHEENIDMMTSKYYLACGCIGFLFLIAFFI